MLASASRTTITHFVLVKLLHWKNTKRIFNKKYNLNKKRCMSVKILFNNVFFFLQFFKWVGYVRKILLMLMSFMLVKEYVLSWQMRKVKMCVKQRCSQVTNCKSQVKSKSLPRLPTVKQSRHYFIYLTRLPKEHFTCKLHGLPRNFYTF